MTILFLYVVGYMIGIGIEVQGGAFKQYPTWAVLIGNAVSWPVVIGKALAK
jgi:hypothetical protein